MFLVSILATPKVPIDSVLIHRQFSFIFVFIFILSALRKFGIAFSNVDRKTFLRCQKFYAIQWLTEGRTMLRRLTFNQTSNLNYLFRNVAKWQTTINLRFLKPSHLQNIRIATCSDIRNKHPARTIEDRHKNNGISRVVAAFKGNPYVRLMRMDKPIGKTVLKLIRTESNDVTSFQARGSFSGLAVGQLR